MRRLDSYEVQQVGGANVGSLVSALYLTKGWGAYSIPISIGVGLITSWAAMPAFTGPNAAAAASAMMLKGFVGSVALSLAGYGMVRFKSTDDVVGLYNQHFNATAAA